MELADLYRRRQPKTQQIRQHTGMSWQAVKIDLQIVAIAVHHQATTFYTDDSNQAEFARLSGLTVRHSWDLPI